MAEETLDARDLKCPLPVLKAARALRGMKAGATLEVLATDEASSRDMPDFCQQAGHELVSAQEQDGVWRYLIRKN